MAKSYKQKKKGAGRFVQLPESLLASEAWADLKPGPVRLYIAIKRRFNGRNNGRIMLSHREAALEMNVHRNTIGPYLRDLIEHGFVRIEQGAHLGPSGVGMTALLALTELATCDGRPATRDFARWQKAQNPGTDFVQGRHNNPDSDDESGAGTARPVLKIVP